MVGWVPVREGVSGEPVWDLVAPYLRSQERIAPLQVNQPPRMKKCRRRPWPG
jgi:sulfur-oxidizing protein SoxB